MVPRSDSASSSSSATPPRLELAHPILARARLSMRLPHVLEDPAGSTRHVRVYEWPDGPQGSRAPCKRTQTVRQTGPCGLSMPPWRGRIGANPGVDRCWASSGPSSRGDASVFCLSAMCHLVKTAQIFRPRLGACEWTYPQDTFLGILNTVENLSVLFAPLRSRLCGSHNRLTACDVLSRTSKIFPRRWRCPRCA